MNVCKEVNCYFQIMFSFIFVLATFSLAFSQNPGDSSDDKQNGLLKVNLEVVKRQYCGKQRIYLSVPNAKGKEKDNYSEKTVEMRLRLN